MMRLMPFVFLVLLSCLSVSAQTQKETNSSINLTVPKAPWTVSFSGGELILDRQQIKPDGQHGYFLLVDNKAEMSISLFIEPAVRCKTSKECRDLVWKHGNPVWKNLQNIVLSEMGDISFVEFMLPEYQGQPIRQQNMYAEFVVDGYWVDLHLSKVLYKPEEHKLFEDLVKSVKFTSKGKEKDAPK